MGAGIFLPINLLSEAKSITTVITSDSDNNPRINAPKNKTWTPPQYSKPALTILTVPSTTSVTSGQPASNEIMYVFDAVFKINHRRSLVKTQHPVLTGANISDHAYIQPAKVTLEIGMSDCMASYSNGIWVGASTKSISAYQILKQLQINKVLLTLTSRLDTYYNMLIEDLSAPDDNSTLRSLKATVSLGEIIAASVYSTPNASAVPQTSGSTSLGTVQSVTPNAAQVEQNVIPSTLWPNTVLYPTVPGAGNVSSTSLGQVPTE